MDVVQIQREVDAKIVASEALHAAEAEEPLPPLLEGLRDNPEFQRLLAEAHKNKPAKPPMGIRAPVVIEDPYRSNNTRMIVIVTDVHVPDQDPAFWRAFLVFLAVTQPDEIILGGDFMELESCSMHKGADLIKYAHDIERGKAALDQLQNACPKAKITYLEGNHETRLTRFLGEKAASLLGSISVPLSLNLKERGITWVPEAEQPIARGTLDILHGHQMEGGGKSKGLPKHHAMKAAGLYGRPGRTVTYGHTHKPQKYTEPSVQGNRRAVGLGCARTLKPGWLHGSEAGWAHEFGIAYVKPDDTTLYYQVDVLNGQFIWGGDVFGDEE